MLFVRTLTRPSSSRVSPISSSVKKCAPPLGRSAELTGATGRGHHHRHPATRFEDPNHLGERRRRVGDQLQDGEGDVASTVSSRSGSCWASARRKPTFGPASALTARASIGSEMSTPNASPSGPGARASAAVTLPGPLPTSRATPPGGNAQPVDRQLPGTHESDALKPVRCRRASTHSGSPHRLDGPVFFGGAACRGQVVKEVEIAIADVRVRRRIGEEIQCPAQRGRQLGHGLVGHSSTLRPEFRRPAGRRDRENPLR